jgi:hypothetical protein
VGRRRRFEQERMGVLIARGWCARRAEVSIFPREPARASPRHKDSPARAPWEPGRGGTNPRRVWPEPGERGRKAPWRPGSPTGATISNTGSCSSRAWPAVSGPYQTCP